MLASEELAGGVASEEEVREVWASFGKLSQEKQNLLISDELAQKLIQLQDTFKCADNIIEAVSILIRWYFFEEIDEKGLQGALEDMFPGKSIDILTFLQKEVFSLKPKPEINETVEVKRQRSENKLLKFSLLKALAEYPRIGEQMVTNEKIRLKNQPEPARPSLANWIRYYRDELGVGFHDQVTRGRFLFQSENGKRLSGEERERINLILKSIEEEYPLDIDTDRMLVVFGSVASQSQPQSQSQPVTPPQPKPRLAFQSPAQMTPARPVKPYVPPKTLIPPSEEVAVSPGKGSFFNAPFGSPAKNVAGDTLHFSTGHVLPGEKEAVASVAAPAPPVTQSDAPPTLTTYNMARINRPSSPPPNPYSIRPLRLRTNAQQREDEAR